MWLQDGTKQGLFQKNNGHVLYANILINIEGLHADEIDFNLEQKS